MPNLPGLSEVSSNYCILIHAGVNLGSVTNLFGNQPWVNADYSPNESADRFRSFFDACTDENREFPDTNGEFPDEFFDDTLWFIQTDSRELLLIWLPAIHWHDGNIAWQWREQ